MRVLPCPAPSLLHMIAPLMKGDPGHKCGTVASWQRKTPHLPPGDSPCIPHFVPHLTVPLQSTGSWGMMARRRCRTPQPHTCMHPYLPPLNSTLRSTPDGAAEEHWVLGDDGQLATQHVHPYPADVATI